MISIDMHHILVLLYSMLLVMSVYIWSFGFIR